MQTVTSARESLRLLIVEDSEDDAQLIERELSRGGFDVSALRVDTAESLITALRENAWDLVISDHALPQFDSKASLHLVREHASHLPFIIVSGKIGEEMAVAAMKAGADDYILKGHLSRLVPAVRRELAAAEARRLGLKSEESLHKTETQLRQAQKMEAVGQLAGGIAHDFNNLLTAILGYSDLLLAHLEPGAPARADVEEIRKAGARAAALTRQLLAFSRRQVPEPRVVDFNDVVRNVEKLLRRVIGEDIEVTTELDPAIGHVRVDPGQMEQVLMNLAVNARDAMPRGGRLRVRTRPVTLALPREIHGTEVAAGSYVVVAVSDTGTGITPDVLKQIFEPFFTTKSDRQGTGLGLATVYGIIKQSSGHIFVDSEPGQGTVFEIYLPCCPAPLDATVPAGGPLKRADGSETVLLVDDDSGILDLVGKVLRTHGYHALSAPNGVEALAMLDVHTGPIDLLITDVVMPRMGGVDLAERLTAARPNLPVLYISGYPDRGERKLARLPAGRAFLQKPFTPSALIGSMRDLFDAAALRPAAPPGPVRVAP